MKKIQVEWKGVTPIILHSCAGVNPLNPITIKIKEVTRKKNKTEDDLRLLSDLEWESGLYYDENVGIYIPAENVEATVRDGAKARKKGKDITKAFNVLDMMIPLDTGEKLTKEQYMADYRFRDVRAMKVMRARVIRTRPRFNMWRINFLAGYDEKVIDLQTIIEAMDYSGKYTGLCDSRPKYGQFVASITELD